MFKEEREGHPYEQLPRNLLRRTFTGTRSSTGSIRPFRLPRGGIGFRTGQPLFQKPRSFQIPNGNPRFKMDLLQLSFCRLRKRRYRTFSIIPIFSSRTGCVWNAKWRPSGEISN